MREYLRTDCQRCHPFILERRVSFFSGQVLAVCNQGGFQKPLQPSSSSSLFPFTPSDILEPLFDGPCPYSSLAYFSVYLRMFSYVYFFQSVPRRRRLRTHTRTNMHTRHMHFCFLPQRNHRRAQVSRVLSWSVSQPAWSCSFHRGAAQCTCWHWNPLLLPRASPRPIRSLPGKEGGGAAPKTRVPRERRRSTVSHFDPMSGSIKSQLLKEARRQGKSDERKGDPTATRPRGPQRSLVACQFSAHA